MQAVTIHDDLSIRTAAEEDTGFILTLNEENVDMLSPMDRKKFDLLRSMADDFVVAEKDGSRVGFLITFREGHDYDSENYAWFLSHFDHFLYVDRVVVAKEYQGHGIGRAFYNWVFNRAKEEGVKTVAAEIDIEPEYNKTSIMFHKAMGFEEVGTQWIRNDTIRVSLQAKSVFGE